MAYAAPQWSIMNRVGKVTLHCKKCYTVLATRETVMLAKVPPSGTHLAVREGKEEQVEGKLHKVENEKGGKSAHYCPFNFDCRGCGERVANVTKVAGKQLICFKIENVYIFHYGKKITANKLSKVSEELEEECGIEVVNITRHAPKTGRADQSRGDSEAMVYCDTSGLTHTSHEIDSLTRQEPRDYQRELFLSAMRGNTLVYLPTGSGKTLIAAMVMSCMKKLNPSKVMVFLVDRVPLAYQQRDYIKSQLTDLRVEALVGEMESPQNGSIHQKLANNKVDVLILTHQIFLNFLAAENNTPIRLSDVSVLVFDEAHHCNGNHPYNKIMEYYKKTPNRFKPVVLGLTASPAGELTVERTSEKLKKLLENLESAVAMPIKSDLLLHVNIPGVIYERSDCMNTDQVLLQEYIEEHIKYLIDVHFKDVPDRQSFAFPVFSPNFRGALRKLIDNYHDNKKSFKALTIAEHAMHLLSVVEVCEALGYQYAVESLKECVDRIVYAKSPKDGALNRLIGRQPSFQALKILADQAYSAEHSRADVMSDRYTILVKHIKQFLDQAREDPTSRGIIFVSLRKTTFKLCELIREIPNVAKMLNPYPFVGHGQGSYDGMTWKDEQEELLTKFRKGISKLLICTKDFAHMPLILAPDRTKLSKRHGAVSVGEYQNRGYLASGMVNYLAQLGWNDGTKQEIYTIEELLDAFKMNRMSKVAAIFDTDKFKWVNGHHVRRLSDEEALAMIGSQLKEHGIVKEVSGEFVAKASQLLRERISTLTEAVEELKSMMHFDLEEMLKTDVAQPYIEDGSIKETAKLLLDAQAEGQFDAIGSDPKAMQHVAKQIGKARGGVKKKALLVPLRLCLTSQAAGPDMNLFFEMLKEVDDNVLCECVSLEKRLEMLKEKFLEQPVHAS